MIDFFKKIGIYIIVDGKTVTKHLGLNSNLAAKAHLHHCDCSYFMKDPIITKYKGYDQTIDFCTDKECLAIGLDIPILKMKVCPLCGKEDLK